MENPNIAQILNLLTIPAINGKAQKILDWTGLAAWMIELIGNALILRCIRLIMGDYQNE